MIAQQEDEDDGEPRLTIVEQPSRPPPPPPSLARSVSLEANAGPRRRQLSREEQSQASEAIESLLLLGQGPVLDAGPKDPRRAIQRSLSIPSAPNGPALSMLQSPPPQPAMASSKNNRLNPVATYYQVRE